MTVSNKMWAIIISIIGLGLFSVIIYQEIKISNMQASTAQQMIAQKALVDNIMRGQSSYATKDDINAFIKSNGDNLKAIQADLNTFHASVASVNVVQANSTGKVATNLPSSNTGTANPTPPAPATIACDGKQIDCPTIDEFGYLQKQQNLDLTEPFGTTNVPIGTVGFSAWQKDPWSVNIAPRQYNLTTVVGVDANDRQYFYNQMSIKQGDKTIDVPITTSITNKAYPSPKFSWWNPRAFLNFGGSVDWGTIRGDANIGGTLGIMSYGKSLVSPDMSILQIGIGYEVISKKPALILTPVSFNVGQLLPKGLVDNTYLGPIISIRYSA